MDATIFLSKLSKVVVAVSCMNHTHAGQQKTTWNDCQEREKKIIHAEYNRLGLHVCNMRSRLPPNRSFPTEFSDYELLLILLLLISATRAVYKVV